MLVGCAAKLPQGFDEAEVKTAAENVIKLLNQRDADGLAAILTDQIKAAITEDVQAQIFALLDDVGAVREISEMKTGGSTHNEISYAVVVAKVKHENQELIYTISFDKEMKLAGLFLK
jgi:alpha-D-ribose 1-methylphosphonate 5-triphosphate synthase subunit PhnH